MEADRKLNIRGLVLPHAAISQLKIYGIYAQTAVSLQHQSVARRYVVRGVESGGAVREAGRYVTFAGENGEALNWLQPLDSLTVNGVHAIVVAPVLTRIEMFRTGRNGRTYELRITRHRPGSGAKGRRPDLMAEDIFRGRDGYLGLELWGKDKELAGTVLPQFFTRSGEELPIPEPFLGAARAVTGAVSCLNCEHSHFLMPASDKQPQRKQEPRPEEDYTASLFAVARAQGDDRNDGLSASGIATGGS